MSRYSIVTYEKAREFVDNLDRIRRARVDRFYSLFEEYGPTLPSKYLKKLSSNLWELRPGDIRLFLAIKGNRGHIVHGIFKKSQKTPKRDLDLAIKRIKEAIG